MFDRPGPRLDIQGLRALSVILVVAFHLWPNGITGGYVGVDVFFVISGFLITKHLIGDAEKHGRPRLSEFWARRIRRLLPASMAVLVAITLGTVVFAPQSYWSQYLGEVAAAAIYGENWRLALDSVDYLAATNAPSPVQHYWSLGVEEQFYLLWPLLVAFASWPRVARIFGGDARRTLMALLAVVIVASFVTSIIITKSNPGIAYFGTHVRAWEFACGGFMSCLRTRPLDKRLASALFSSGFAMILAAGFLFDAQTPFPGYTALLPVLGAALCLGTPPPHSRILEALYSFRFVQVLGDLSYSIYLWHWPLIILGPYVLDRELTQIDRAGICVLTLGLSFATKRWIEDPIRFGLSERWRSRRASFLLAALSSLAMVALTGRLLAPISNLEQQVQGGDSGTPAEDACKGAAALDSKKRCVAAPSALSPNPAVAKLDRPQIYEGDKCRTSPNQSEVKPCREGPADGPRVALVGDSHAAQWHPALVQLADKRGWSITVYFKAACPFSDATSGWTGSAKRSSCAEWNAAVLERLRAEKYDLIVTSAVGTHTYDDDGVAGFASRWRQLQAIGGRVVVIADTPRMTRKELDCLLDEHVDPATCGRPTKEAVSFDPQRDAALGLKGVTLVDPVPFICPDDFCPAVIGNVIVYRDTSSHMTQTFVRTLAPFLEREIPFSLR